MYRMTRRKEASGTELEGRMGKAATEEEPEEEGVTEGRGEEDLAEEIHPLSRRCTSTSTRLPNQGWPQDLLGDLRGSTNNK